jgi:hypothetical protein
LSIELEVWRKYVDEGWWRCGELEVGNGKVKMRKGEVEVGLDVDRIDLEARAG